MASANQQAQRAIERSMTMQAKLEGEVRQMRSVSAEEFRMAEAEVAFAKKRAVPLSEVAPVSPTVTQRLAQLKEKLLASRQRAREAEEPASAMECQQSLGNWTGTSRYESVPIWSKINDEDLAAKRSKKRR